MTSRLASTALLLLVTGAAAQSCDLQCFQGAPCVTGSAEFGAHPMNSDGSPVFSPGALTHNGVDQHCACPHGWTGVLCDVEYKSCDGEHKCYNGGSCVPGLIDEFGNEQLFCDCTDAVTDDGELFVGKFCEHPSTELCSATNEEHFCVNGGICNTQYPQFGTMCECEEGYDGPHCEFKSGAVPDCNLNCGVGHCVLGIRDPSEIHDIGHLFQQEGGVMHCVCPPGNSGSRCEISTQSCGEHECFHGGTCLSKEKDGQTYHHCDCSSAHTETLSYAGRFCQYESTSTCFDDPQNGKVFCVNGGTCPAESYQACSCSEDFFGPSCEFAHETTVPEGPDVVVINEDDDEIEDPEDDDDVDDDDIDDEVVDDDMGQDLDDDALEQEIEEEEEEEEEEQEMEEEMELEDDDDRPRNDDDDDEVPEDDDEVDEFEEAEEDDDIDDDEIDEDDDIDDDDYAGGDEDGDGVPNYADCALKCEHGGTCRKGVKDHGIIKEYVDGSSHFESHDENFEHCICPSDWVGLRCEHPIERCPSGQHACLHGGKCVVNGDEEKCNCAGASLDGMIHVAGAACEHAATEICTTGELEPAQPRSFCVNEGSCKAKITPGQDHPGCNCVGEWTGPHCELKTPSSGSNTDSSEAGVEKEPSDKKSGTEIFIILLAVAAVLTTICCAYCQVRKLQRRAQELEEQVALQPNTKAYSDDPNLVSTASKGYSDNPSSNGSMTSNGSNFSAGSELPNLAAGESESDAEVYIGPPRDEDGHELHSVEIL